MKIKLLLVEDDHDLGMVIKQYLELSNYEVTWFTNPLDLLSDISILNSKSLAILDVMLPEMDGFQLSKEIRKHAKIPFLFLTAKVQSIDRILGLKLGADDYISKPCEPEELLLRIKNILRKQEKVVTPNIIVLGNYTFNPALFLLSIADKNFQLTEKEAELLLLLYKNNNKVINRKDILEQIWGENDFFLGRSLDVFMTRLRKYLQHDERIKFDSIRGVGFKVEIPE